MKAAFLQCNPRYLNVNYNLRMVGAHLDGVDADLIAHPSNLVRPDCPRSIPIRALENHVFTVTANRYGSETKDDEALTFIGQSEICDPDGQVLLRAGRTGDHFGAVTIDPAAARDRQITAHNHLFADRRPELYRLR